MSKKILSFKNYIHEKKDNVIVFYKYKIMFIPYVYIHVILICLNRDRQINK